MKVTYQAVHKLPDGSEQEICHVEEMTDIEFHVETPRYVGTWLTPYRKLLRYGRGEIEIRRRRIPMKVAGKGVFTENGQKKCRLRIENGEGLEWVILSVDEIAGYNLPRTEKLWQVNNFTELAETIEKEAAYECLQIYEKFIADNQLESAL